MYKSVNQLSLYAARWRSFGVQRVSLLQILQFRFIPRMVYAQLTPPARQDRTVLSVSCLMVCRCELDDCSERTNFLSAIVLSCRESNSHRRSKRTQTKQFCRVCLAWRCELVFTRFNDQGEIWQIERILGQQNERYRNVSLQQCSRSRKRVLQSHVFWISKKTLKTYVQFQRPLNHSGL